jgi:hypothetical protein
MSVLKYWDGTSWQPVMAGTQGATGATGPVAGGLGYVQWFTQIKGQQSYKWNVRHNLDSRYVNVELIEYPSFTSFSGRYNYPTIFFEDNNSLIVTWEVVNATGIQSGYDYEIITVGDTDFTLIGASSNTPGLIFTATGTGTGTGTAGLAPQGLVSVTFGGQGATGPIGPAGIGQTGATGLQGSTGATGLPGDLYSTTSSTSLTIDLGLQTLQVDAGLAYTVPQNIIVANNGSNYMKGTVLSYNKLTGVLAFTAIEEEGSGTYNTWFVNLDGAAGGEGATGATGEIGPTGATGLTGGITGGTLTGNIIADNYDITNIGNLTADDATLGSLTVTAEANFTDIGILNIPGGIDGKFIKTEGSGVLTYAYPGTADNVLYVSKSGSDYNTGTSLDDAKLTIKSAAARANELQTLNPSGTTVILVKAGDYSEQNPISLNAGVSIVGDNLRAVTVRPSNPTLDIFWVRNRCYITGMTFRDHLEPAAAVAFPNTGAGFIVTSPYIQNCSSITTTGAGMRVDGNLAGGLKSMVLDSYTQFNQGGLGIHITNMGYAQLVSIFTICCTAGVKCENGGTCSITNSNNSFGVYGLWAEGAGPVLYTGTLTAVTRETMTFSNLPQRPAVNDAVLVTDGVNSQYVLVREATPVVGGISTITFAETLTLTPTLSTVCDFRQISLISASSQTFEYVGTGTNILTATPRLGGIPIQANEIRQTNGGRVNYTSTDQFGDFRIGDGLLISEEAGIIEGETFDKSLFAVLTPYILALEG